MTERKPYIWPLPEPKSCGDDQSRPALGHRDLEGSSRHKNLEACLDSGRGSSQVSGENPPEDEGYGYLHQELGGSRSERKGSGASLHHCEEAYGSPSPGPEKPILCEEPKDHPPEDRAWGGNTLHKSPGRSGFRAGIERAGTSGRPSSASLDWRENRKHSATTDPGSRGARGPGRGSKIYPGAARGQVSESQHARGGCCGLRSEDESSGSKIQRHQDHSYQYPRYQQIAPHHPKPQPPENLQFLYHQSLHYEWLRTSFANPLAYEPRYYSFKHYACQYYDLVQQFGFQHYGVWPNLYHLSHVPPPSPPHEAPHYYQDPLPNFSDNLPEQPSPESYSPEQAFRYQTPQQSSSNPIRLDNQSPQRSTYHENPQHQAPPPSRSDEVAAPYHDQETLLENSKDAIGGRSEHDQLHTGGECTSQRNKSGGKRRLKVARRTWNDITEKEITLILNTAPLPNPVAALFPPGRGLHARKREPGEYTFRLPAQTDAGHSGQVRRNLVSLPFLFSPLKSLLPIHTCMQAKKEKKSREKIVKKKEVFYLLIYYYYYVYDW